MGAIEEETEKIIAELKKYLLHERISSNADLIMLIMLHNHPISTSFSRLVYFEKLNTRTNFVDKLFCGMIL